MSQHDPTKRIPKSMGTDTKLFGTFTMTDLAVGLFPGVIVVLATQVLLPSSMTVLGYSVQAFTIPIAGLAIVIGGVFVYLTPRYTTSADWLGAFLSFLVRSTEVDHATARTYSQVERIHPDRGAIERTDGALIGMVQVEPPTMALATTEEWKRTAESFQDFLNTTIEFPVQLYSTTSEFPVDAYLERYESRLDDPDVDANPQLAALIEHYVDWYGSELERRQMTIRDHYVVVPVTPGEVQFDAGSVTHQLAELPYVGIFVMALFGPSLQAEREAMFEALDERLRRVETGLRDVRGCTANRVPVKEATLRIADFWAGESVEYGNLEQVLRTTALVGGDSQ